MIRRLAGSRLLRLFSTSIVDQAMLSAANFVVGLLLIRYTSDIHYGYFVLAQTSVQLLINAQAAWVSVPISVLGPKKEPQARREMIGAIEISQRRFLRVCAALAMLVPPLGYLLGFWSALLAGVGAASVLAGWTALQREFMRSVLFVYSRPHVVFAVDAAYVAVLLIMAAIAAFGPAPAAVVSVLALAAASFTGRVLAHRSLARDPGWVVADAAPVWREMRPIAIWVVFSVVAYWAFSQSYNYVLAGKLSVVAVAEVNATRLLLSPIVLMTVGVRALLVPSSATWLQESGLGALLRKLTIFGLALLAVDLVYVLVLWLCRDWLVGSVLHKTIADRDRMLILWSITGVLGLIRDVYQCGMLALEQFKRLSWITFASTPVALAVSWFGIDRWGAIGAQVGLITGEALSLIGTVTLALLAMRYSKHSAARINPAR